MPSLPHHTDSLARLEARIVEKIASNGAIPLSVYMKMALGDSEAGYYQVRDPFGRAGDFTTAPEISGLFGEMCGLYLAYLAQAANASDMMVLELGPGRGSLMADMRNAWNTVMPDLAKAPIHLLETSPTLRQTQTAKLAGAKINFHSDLDALPPVPLYAIANEFFDALPIDQLIWCPASGAKTAGGQWHHRNVGLVNDRLQFVIGAPVDVKTCKGYNLPDIAPADPKTFPVAEICPQATTYMAKLAAHIATHGGACLIIDYGRDGQTGDSLQAVANHQPVDVFYRPGAADLSHWVDFAALRRAAEAEGARLIGPEPQGRFLRRIGIMQRAEAAGRLADAATRRDLHAAVDRLISTQHMGLLFKVALLIPAGAGLPEGFTTPANEETGG